VFDQKEMATNSVQRFIDQHPSLFIALFSVSLIALWSRVGAISFIGGWFSLSKLYQRRVPFESAVWTMQSGQMRWLTNYSKVLTFGASGESLYLNCCALFFSIHAPALANSVGSNQSAEKQGVDIRLRDLHDEPGNGDSARIRARLAETLQTGHGWPVEEV
jgi:hypothetical protein